MPKFYTLIMQPSVFVTEKGNAATDTRRVAEKFGKRHSDVLRAVREIVRHLAEDEAQRKIASGSIFHPHYYLDGNNQQRELFIMNRAAFTVLVLGFTGKKATLFKDQYVAEFDRMDVELRRMTVGQPAPRRLSDFAQPAVQIECVKEVGKALYLPNNDPGAIINHHRQVSVLLTGLRPSDYVREFVKKGLRVASLSARQLMRRLEPAKACTAAFLDDARVRGKSLAQLESAGVVEALPQAFDALLRAGYSLEELGA